MDNVQYLYGNNCPRVDEDTSVADRISRQPIVITLDVGCENPFVAIAPIVLYLLSIVGERVPLTVLVHNE